MPASLTDLFNTPPEWADFASLIEDLGAGTMNFDVVPILDLVTPLMQDYRASTVPHHFRDESEGNYFVFCNGLSERGTMGYRVIRIAKDKRLEVLDARRVMDHAELYGRHSRKAKEVHVARALKETLTKGMTTVKRRLGSDAAWVDDLRFLHSVTPTHYYDLATARKQAVADMMTVVRAGIPMNEEHYKYLARHLQQALEKHDDAMDAQAAILLQQAKDTAHPEIMSLFDGMPAAQTATNYRWMAWDKNPQRAAFRRKVIKVYPILLLVNGIRNIIRHYESDLARHKADEVASTLLHCRIDPRKAVLFKSMREADLGAANAYRLLDIIDYLPRLTEAGPYQPADTAAMPHTPEAWTEFVSLIDAAKSMGNFTKRGIDPILPQLQKLETRELIGTSLDIFDIRTRQERLQEMSIWLNRFATVLAITMMTQAMQQGFRLPVEMALKLAGHTSPVFRHADAGLPRSMRDKINARYGDHYPMPLSVLRDVPVMSMVESSFHYMVQRGSWDEALRNLIISNRLFENGAAYPWHPLPAVKLPEYPFTFVPLSSQADLSKESLRAGHDVWRMAPQAIIDGMHFVSIRRSGSHIAATAAVEEPAFWNDAWHIRDIVMAEGEGRNDYFEAMQGYLNSPEFKEQINLSVIRATRAKLYDTLSSRAHSHEHLGINPYDHEERRTLSLLFGRFVPMDAEIDDYGCFTNPDIDKRMRDIVSILAPAFKAQPQGHNLTP